jgi:predicted nucleic acid-binding protein
MTVVDASIGVKWFIREPGTESATQLLDIIWARRDTFIVPELFFYEVFAVVSRKHRDTALWVREGLPWLLDLPLHRVILNAELGAIMQEYTNRGLSGYDAAYVALAVQNEGRWITFDQRARSILGQPEWIINPDQYMNREGSAP